MDKKAHDSKYCIINNYVFLKEIVMNFRNVITQRKKKTVWLLLFNLCQITIFLLVFRVETSF